MDIDRFGRGYRDLPEKNPPTNPERREILEAPRMWMRFFDTAMKGYLAGDTPPDHDEFTEKLMDYYLWSRFYLEPLAERAEQLHEQDNIGHATREFAFHRMNTPVTFMWDQLLFGKASDYTTTDTTSMQTELAMAMVPAAKQLREIPRDHTTKSVRQRYLEGDLTDADSLLVSLEMTKKYPDIIVVPAPERYENNRRQVSHNIDLLFIDPIRRHARGAQAKTSVFDEEKTARYDPDFVSIIDGAHDLGNTTYTNHYNNRIMTLPGQISMNFLADRTIKEAPYIGPKIDFLRSRLLAKEMTRGHKSFLPQATKHVIDRIMPVLHTNPGDEFNEAAPNERSA